MGTGGEDRLGEGEEFRAAAEARRADVSGEVSSKIKNRKEQEQKELEKGER